MSAKIYVLHFKNIVAQMVLQPVTELKIGSCMLFCLQRTYGVIMMISICYVRGKVLRNKNLNTCTNQVVNVAGYVPKKPLPQ